MSLDFYAKQPTESAAAHKERIRKHESAEFEKKKKFMEQNRSTYLPYDERTLKMQIVEMTNDITDKCFSTSGEKIRELTNDEKEIYAIRFSHLREMSQMIFNNILSGVFPDPKEIKCIMAFHKLIAEGKMTKYAASAAYSEYRITQLMNKNKPELSANDLNGADQKNKTFDNAWDIMRTKNSFADESIYD